MPITYSVFRGNPDPTDILKGCRHISADPYAVCPNGCADGTTCRVCWEEDALRNCPSCDNKLKLITTRPHCGGIID